MAALTFFKLIYFMLRVAFQSALRRYCLIQFQVVVNPAVKCVGMPPMDGFMERLSARIAAVDAAALLGSTDTVGTVSFRRPTLYVFPAGDAASSLFFGVQVRACQSVSLLL